MEIFKIFDHDQTYARFTKWLKFLQDNKSEAKAVEKEHAESICKLLALMEDECKALELDAVADLISFTSFELATDDNWKNVSISELAHRLSAIEFLFQSQASKNVFFRLTAEESVMFNSKHLFGPDVANAFPSADTSHEIREAGKCFALARYSASVFHLMRVLEKGLKALAENLLVQFTIPVDYLNWQNIIEQVEAKIKDLEKQKPGQQKTDRLKTYSEIARQFRYFKDAWRNGVAHSRETYDKGQATSILRHVEEFMQDITKLGLKELP